MSINAAELNFLSPPSSEFLLSSKRWQDSLKHYSYLVLARTQATSFASLQQRVVRALVSENDQREPLTLNAMHQSLIKVVTVMRIMQLDNPITFHQSLEDLIVLLVKNAHKTCDANSMHLLALAELVVYNMVDSYVKDKHLVLLAKAYYFKTHSLEKIEEIIKKIHSKYAKNTVLQELFESLQENAGPSWVEKGIFLASLMEFNGTDVKNSTLRQIAKTCIAKNDQQSFHTAVRMISCSYTQGRLLQLSQGR